MDGENLTLVIAFAAGVLSFASPCVLPLVPAYIGHMMAVSAERPGRSRRVVSLLHATSFVAGFSLVFVAFWTSVSVVGFVFLDNARFLRRPPRSILFPNAPLFRSNNRSEDRRVEYTVDAGW